MMIRFMNDRPDLVEVLFTVNAKTDYDSIRFIVSTLRVADGVCSSGCENFHLLSDCLVID